MELLEFLRRKNKLIQDFAGNKDLILIPKEQMFDIEKRILPEDTIFDGDICPYCLVFNDREEPAEVPCGGCPMNEAGNMCDNEDSTYTRIKEVLDKDFKIDSLRQIPGMLELIREYNSTIEHK